MRNFTFRLQSILDIRRHQEDQCRLELGEVVSRKSMIEGEILTRRTMRTTNLTVLPGESTAIDLVYRNLQAAYALRLEREIVALEKQLVQVEQERLEAATRYQRARQKAEALEKLRERRHAGFKVLRKREEQLRLDDSAIHLRRNSGHAVQ